MINLLAAILNDRNMNMPRVYKYTTATTDLDDILETSFKSDLISDFQDDFDDFIIKLFEKYNKKISEPVKEKADKKEVLEKVEKPTTLKNNGGGQFYPCSKRQIGEFSKVDCEVSPTGDYVDNYLKIWTVTTYDLDFPRWENDRFVVIREEEKLDCIIPCGERNYIYRLPKGYPATYNDLDKWADKIRREFACYNKDGYTKRGKGASFQVGKSLDNYGEEYTFYEIAECPAKRECDIIRKSFYSANFDYINNARQKLSRKKYIDTIINKKWDSICKHKYEFLIGKGKDTSRCNGYILYDNKYMVNIQNLKIDGLTEDEFLYHAMDTVNNLIETKSDEYYGNITTADIDEFLFVDKDKVRARYRNVKLVEFSVKDEYKNDTHKNYTFNYDSIKKFGIVLDGAANTAEAEFYLDSENPDVVGYHINMVHPKKGIFSSYGILNVSRKEFEKFYPVEKDNKRLGYEIGKLVFSVLDDKKEYLEKIEHHIVTDNEFGVLRFINKNNINESSRFEFNRNLKKDAHSDYKYIIAPNNI